MGEDGPRSQTCGLSNKTFQIKTGILAKKRKPDGKYFTRVFFLKKIQIFLSSAFRANFYWRGAKVFREDKHRAGCKR